MAAALVEGFGDFDARIDNLEKTPRGSGPALPPNVIRFGTPDHQDRDRISKRAPIDKVPFTKSLGRRRSPSLLIVP